MNYIYTAIVITILISSAALFRTFQTETVVFDDPDEFDITEIPIPLAVYLIDKNLKIATERLTNVAALQQLIIEKQEVQTQLNIRTEERLTAEEAKE